MTRRKPDIGIPARFWKTVSQSDFLAIAARGGFLNAEETARLWRMTDRQDAPPKAVEVFFSENDIRAAFKEIQKARLG